MHCAQSCATPYGPMDYIAHQLLCLWNFPGKNTQLGCHFLLKGIFPTQGFNPSLASPVLASRFFTTSIQVLVLGRICMPDFY